MTRADRSSPARSGLRVSQTSRGARVLRGAGLSFRDPGGEAVRNETTSSERRLIAALAVVGLVAVPAALVGHRPAPGRTRRSPSKPRPHPHSTATRPTPNIVLDGSTYYAFTTGTGLGNHLQALIDTSGSPLGGWRSYTGLPFGSTALPGRPVLGTGEHPDLTWCLLLARSVDHVLRRGDRRSRRRRRVQLPVGRDRGLALPQPGLRRPLDRTPRVPVGPRRCHRPEPLRRPADRDPLPGLEVERRRLPRAGTHLVAATELERHEPRRVARPS